MSNIYNWSVTAMDVYPQAAGQNNVVFNLHWECNGNDGTGTANTPSANTGRVYNTQQVTYKEGDSFTAYSDLTQNTVITWVQSALGESGVEAVHSSIDTQIANKQNPPVITPALPWIATPNVA